MILNYISIDQCEFFITLSQRDCSLMIVYYVSNLLLLISCCIDVVSRVRCSCQKHQQPRKTCVLLFSTGEPQCRPGQLQLGMLSIRTGARGSGQKTAGRELITVVVREWRLDEFHACISHLILGGLFLANKDIFSADVVRKYRKVVDVGWLFFLLFLLKDTLSDRKNTWL